MACVPRKTVNVKDDREGCYEGSILPGTMYICYRTKVNSG